ncbi:MAG: hypothetical protein KJ063_25550 [Anaerolineae bacterium]|nr:hypothetical protein [Anaerolineae bacterium]
MSEVIVVALISLIGTIAGASINAYASIKSSESNSKSNLKAGPDETLKPINYFLENYCQGL